MTSSVALVQSSLPTLVFGCLVAVTGRVMRSRSSTGSLVCIHRSVLGAELTPRYGVAWGEIVNCHAEMPSAANGCRVGEHPGDVRHYDLMAGFGWRDLMRSQLRLL